MHLEKTQSIKGERVFSHISHGMCLSGYGCVCMCCVAGAILIAENV